MWVQPLWDRWRLFVPLVVLLRTCLLIIRRSRTSIIYHCHTKADFSHCSRPTQPHDDSSRPIVCEQTKELEGNIVRYSCAAKRSGSQFSRAGMAVLCDARLGRRRITSTWR